MQDSDLRRYYDATAKMTAREADRIVRNHIADLIEGPSMTTNVAINRAWARLALQLRKEERIKVTLGSSKMDWMTPPYFLGLVRLVAPIALDPCGSRQSFVNAWWTYFGRDHLDGLVESWWVPDDALVFYNPPYGRELGEWMMKCAYEASLRRHAQHFIGLVPARVGTGYWREHVWPNVDAVCFWHGGDEHPSRMLFYDPVTGKPALTGATFDAAVLYTGPNVKRFVEVFEHYGTVKYGKR